MPIVTGKNTGSQNVAKAVANVVDLSGDVAAAGVFNSRVLKTPGIPKLTCNVRQLSGANSLTCYIQGAARLNQGGTLDWIFLTPQFLTLVGGDPIVIELNIAVQAIRLHVENEGAGTGSLSFILSATG